METLDRMAPTNQYDVRVRRPGGPIEVKVILDHPRQGIEADLEFAAQWAGADAHEVNENWHILSVTDMALLVTYLPSTLAGRPAGPYFYNRDHYVVPDRDDNPRFYDALLSHKKRPELTRGYSFVITVPVDPRIHRQGLRQHIGMPADWKLVKDSIVEIELEQHYYLTWQRQQIPNYFGGPQARIEPELTLTKKQTTLWLKLAQAGYLLHYSTQGWEVGELIPTDQLTVSTYRPLMSGRTTPAEAILEATKHLLPPLR